MDLPQLLEPLVELCAKAGRAILEVYATDFEVQEKHDTSPLTLADMASHNIIVAGLEQLTPGIPVISEEAGLPEFALRSAWQRYWLIDPLDGTKEFVGRNGEFTVNVALIDDGRPILGVVLVPVSGITYAGCEGLGAQRRDAAGTSCAINVATTSELPVRVVGSRSHRGTSLDTWLENLGKFSLQPMGSSLKFCCVAEGSADVYPRLGPTSEWDTAAAQAVVEQAGGRVVTLDGKPLRYGHKADILNPWFMVSGPQDKDWLGFVPQET